MPAPATSASPSLTLTLVLGALAAVAPLSIDMYLPALPAIARALDDDIAAVQLTLSVFFAGSAIGQLAWGPLSDRFGRRAPLLAGLTLYAFASMGCALAQDTGTLVFMRAMQALGACATSVIPRALVRDLFDPAQGARLMSSIMLVMGVAPILAPVGGGLLLHLGDWHLLFWLLAVYGLALLIVVRRLLPAGRPGDGRPLHPGTILRGYLDLLRDRIFLLRGLAGGFAFGGMFAYITAAPGVFIEWLGLSPQAFAWLFGLNAAGLIACSQWNGRMLRRHSPRKLLGRAVFVQAGAGVALALVAWRLPSMGLSATGATVALVLPLATFLAAMGCILPNATVVAMEPCREKAGTASGLLGVLQFGLAAMVSAATSALGVATGKGPLAMAVVIAVCGVVSATLQRRALRD